MSDATSPLRPSQLWKRLPLDRKSLAAEAFWNDENAVAEQAEALALIAQRIKSRLKSVAAMPLEKMIRQLVLLPALPDVVAARVLVAYHLAHQLPMMGRFLDALGIAHENGLIADENLSPPSPDRLASAAQTIAAEYHAADVSLYLSTLVWQDPGTWGGLSEVAQQHVS